MNLCCYVVIFDIDMYLSCYTGLYKMETRFVGFVSQTVKFPHDWWQEQYEGEVEEQIRVQTPVVLLSFVEEYQIRICPQTIFSKKAFFQGYILCLKTLEKFLFASIWLEAFEWMTQMQQGCVWVLL